jgi:hypothetical protein
VRDQADGAVRDARCEELGAHHTTAVMPPSTKIVCPFT